MWNSMSLFFSFAFILCLMMLSIFFFFFLFMQDLYLQYVVPLVASCGIFTCTMWTLSCHSWDLVSWTGIKLRHPPLGAQSLSHWTTSEVPWASIHVLLEYLCNFFGEMSVQLLCSFFLIGLSFCWIVGIYYVFWMLNPLYEYFNMCV